MKTSNDKKISVLIIAITTVAAMAAGTVNLVFGLPSHQGDYDSAGQEYDRFDDCMSNHEQEGDEITMKEIEHCIDVAYRSQSNESTREDNDDNDDDDRTNMQSADKDSAFVGDDSEDSDSSSNNFNNDSDFARADGENSSTSTVTN